MRLPSELYAQHIHRQGMEHALNSIRTARAEELDQGPQHSPTLPIESPIPKISKGWKKLDTTPIHSHSPEPGPIFTPSQPPIPPPPPRIKQVQDSSPSRSIVRPRSPNLPPQVGKCKTWILVGPLADSKKTPVERSSPNRTVTINSRRKRYGLKGWAPGEAEKPPTSRNPPSPSISRPLRRRHSPRRPHVRDKSQSPERAESPFWKGDPRPLRERPIATGKAAEMLGLAPKLYAPNPDGPPGKRKKRMLDSGSCLVM